MNVAIIAAAGQGTRMGSERAKQFLELAGVPIIIHTLRAFEQCEVIQEIIVVVAPGEQPGFLSLLTGYGLSKVTKVIPGGSTRSESVLRGLQAIGTRTEGVVAVHDGVRPFVTPDEITRTVKAAELHDAAILVAPVTDTIKEVIDGGVIRSVNRSRLRRALTPQCFRYSLLRRAYEQAEALGPEVTDESMLVERLGVRIATIEGHARNIKITSPEDLVIGEALLESWC
jgi:2-C-methyl-D-erythritol 4-phosphate cytidylyltransferase